jgi:asparagine synthase (glutamine-hydrolysing)
VLAAFDCWGPACLERFNGMWAFALWDARERTLTLARDRFGVKPLFYARSPHQLIFGSEIKALLPVRDFPLEPDLPVVRDALTGGTPDRCLRTVFKSVMRLAPGSWMRVGMDGRTEAVTWWDTWRSRPEVPRKPQEQVERYRELFQDACRIRLRSDVPVGTLLSGGIDSSSIVCTIARHRGLASWSRGERLAPEWQRTFTAEYPGLSADEGEYPRIVLNAVGVDGTFIRPTVDDAERMMHHMVDQQDAPVDQSLYAVHSVYRAVSEHGVRVTLDGQGADEALSGYETLTAAQHYLLAGNLRQALLSVDGQVALGGGGTRRRLLADLALAAARKKLPMKTLLRKAAGLPQPRAMEPMTGLPSQALLDLPACSTQVVPDGAGILDAALHDQLHRSVLPGILRRFDHAAMSYSVESRMPFMDWRLLTYSMALPVEQKVFSGLTKVVLRSAMKGTVPDAVLERRAKLGFPIPREWLAEPVLAAWIDRVTGSRDFREMPYWNAARVRERFRTLQDRRLTSRDLIDAFAVLGTFVWHRGFFGERSAA